MVRYPPPPGTQFHTGTSVRYPTKTSTKEFCDTIAASIARYEKYRYWASVVSHPFFLPSLCWPRLFPFSRHFLPFSPPQKVLSRARGTAQTLERGNFSMDLSKVREGVFSPRLREDRSGQLQFLQKAFHPEKFSEKLEKAVTVYLKQHPAQRVGTRCRGVYRQVCLSRRLKCQNPMREHLSRISEVIQEPLPLKPRFLVKNRSF